MQCFILIIIVHLTHLATSCKLNWQFSLQLSPYGSPSTVHMSIHVYRFHALTHYCCVCTWDGQFYFHFRWFTSWILHTRRHTIILVQLLSHCLYVSVCFYFQLLFYSSFFHIISICRVIYIFHLELWTCFDSVFFCHSNKSIMIKLIKRKIKASFSNVFEWIPFCISISMHGAWGLSRELWYLMLMQIGWALVTVLCVWKKAK